MKTANVCQLKFCLRMMKHDFYTIFKPVVQVANNGGIYLPDCEKIYRWGGLIKFLVHLNLFLAVTDIVTLIYGEFTFLITGKEALGLTKYYMVLGLGTLIPSYIRVVYAQIRCLDLKRIVNIWEVDLANPPYPNDRNVEIKIVQKSLATIVKIQVFFFIIPLTIWSSRPVVTKQEVIPTGFPGNHYETPAFELITAFITFTGYYVGSVWAAFEAIQILIMKLIIAELNHLHIALQKILNVIQEEETKYPGLIHDVKGNLWHEKFAEVRRMLRIWIKHHQNVLKFNHASNKFFGPTLLLHSVTTIAFASTCLFLGIMGEIRLDNRLEIEAYLFFYMYVLFKSCSWGDEIQVKSANIMEPFHDKPWYLYPKDILRTVLIIEHLAMNRPIRLKASGFKTLSRKSFGEITQKGYEIITFMTHFIRKRNRP